MHHTVIRVLLIIAGWTAITLGTVGIFLPILPTTPFLLLAAFCFSKSSKRFHTWLLANTLFGPFITNWECHRGLTVWQKTVSIGMLWLTIGISVIFFVHFLFAKIAMLTVAVSVSIFLWRMKTVATSPVCSHGQIDGLLSDTMSPSIPDSAPSSHPIIPSSLVAHPITSQNTTPANIDIRESA